jgi:polyisoprenoid-binding protein YceI
MTRKYRVENGSMTYRQRGLVAMAFAGMLTSLASLPAQAASYRIDPAETTASFETWFLGVMPIRGAFKHTAGTLVFDRETQLGSIEVIIETGSVVAPLASVQAYARSPGFFDVARFPFITFRSTRFVLDEKRLANIEGMLTMVGLSHPVILAVRQTHCAAASSIAVAQCGAKADLTLQRSAFGMSGWANSVGDDVTIRLAIVAKAATIAEAVKP